MHMHLGSADFRKVTRADHENAEWAVRRLVLSITERFAGRYITHHDLSESRPPAPAW